MEQPDLEILVVTSEFYIINTNSNIIVLSEFVKIYKEFYGSELYSQEIFNTCKLFTEKHHNITIYDFYVTLYRATSDVEFIMTLLKFADLSTGEYINIIKSLIIVYPDINTVVKYSLLRFPNETELLKLYLAPTIIDVYKKYIDSLDEINKLKQKNDDLKQENDKLKLKLTHYQYMPGSDGYEQAKKNFEESLKL